MKYYKNYVYYAEKGLLCIFNDSFLVACYYYYVTITYCLPMYVVCTLPERDNVVAVLSGAREKYIKGTCSTKVRKKSYKSRIKY